jgi:hypothetical protein
VKKVLIGCAIVAGILVLTLVGGGVFVASWVKKEMPDFEQVEQSREALVAQHGTREDYAPRLDGLLRPERIEAFLAVRESLMTTRSDIATRTEALFARAHGEQWDDRGLFQKIGDAFSMARGGIGLVREGAGYIGARVDQLLAAGMGEGEYTYLYSLMVYSWLEWDAIEEFGDDWFVEHDMENVPEEFRDEYRRMFVRQLRNQRAALEEKTERSAEEAAMFERVQEVIQKARDTPHRFPYEGEALPEHWRSVLEPYRDRFTATLPTTPAEYLVDSIEQLIDDEQQGVNIQFD